MIIRLFIFCFVPMLFSLPAAHAASYDARLPARLSTDPDLCAHVPCRDVIEADSFSRSNGRPSYVEAYRTEKEKKEEHRKLVGYVFLSTDIVDIPGYSGKPLVTLIGMDTKGIITGVKILQHHESALLVGIPETRLAEFTHQYVGKFVGDRIEMGKARAESGYMGIDAISGATVTAVVENQVILRSAREIAKQVGIIQSQERPPARFAAMTEPHDWQTLMKEGSIGRLTISGADVGVDTGTAPYIDIYFGYLNVPSIGISILGEENYRRLMADLRPGEHAIFIVANGVASFKGSGFARGGIYERIEVTQGLDSFVFRDTDYLNLYRIQAAGAPPYRESGIFVIRSQRFSAAYPWHLMFLANAVDKETGAKTFLNFEREYRVPAKYLEGGWPASTG